MPPAYPPSVTGVQRSGEVVGWQKDPYGRHELRFFDGHRWTPYVRDGAKDGMDEPGGPVGGTAPTRTPLPAENMLLVELFAVIGRRWSDRSVLRPNGVKAG